MKYFFRSFCLFLLISIFIIRFSFALQISDIDSGTGHNWFKVSNDSSDISNFANGDYRVFENGKSHLIYTISSSQDKNLNSSETAFIVNSTSSFLSLNPEYSGILFDSSFDLPNSDGYVAITDKENTNFFACKSYGSGVCPNTSITSTTSTSTIVVPPAPTTTITSNTVYIYLPLNNQNKYGDINVLLPSERIVPAGAEVDFTVKAVDSQKKLVSGLDFNWSFGDGGEKFAKDVTHHYVYPGEYILIVTADGYTSGGQARMNVKVITPDLKIIKAGTNPKENFIDLFNNTEYDLFLSNFYLNVDNTFYQIPKNFMIGKKSLVHLSGEAMGFKLPAYNISLHFPNKSLLLSFSSNANINSTTSSSSSMVGLTQATSSQSVSNIPKVTFKRQAIIQDNILPNLSGAKDFLVIKKLKLKKEGEESKLKLEQFKDVKNVDIDIVKWFKSLIY